MKAVTYLRVSTKTQGRSGLGLDAQREIIDRFLQSKGGSLIHEYVDVVSGARADRETLQKAISHAKSIKGVLVIAKLDRLSRKVSFISALMDAGVDFVVADLPDASRFTIHLFSAFAEEERRLISERTKSALQAAKSRGVIIGSNGKHLATLHKQGALDYANSIQSIICPLWEDLKSFKRVAERLNEIGVSSRNGDRWHPYSVSRVCKRLALC